MRKVVTAAFVSLDGVMQAPGGPEEDPTGGFALGGWVFPHADDIMGQALDKTFGTPFDLLLGRKTYEIFAAHWPYVAADDPIGKVFNAVTKYVATRSAAPLSWQNSVALRGDAAKTVAELKRHNGPTLLLQGSGDLIQTLLAHDLIDEFRLMTFPIVLGPGKRLFGRGAIPAGLKLVDSKVSTTGVVISSYVRSGEVTTGSFALAEPTEAELARRERMKREG
ncbi:dihydrofolate reductase family protein [Inquilinus sp. OTU3971]|uniref:dihydrofolate reductase family protein n=1 Tax=Inquilinus sp. OTU3971 TaxID=3043855 RepID=UPI00313BB3E4